MPAIKLLNIFALSTLAILLCSFAPSQTFAVSIQANHLARQLPNHHGIAKKKRGTKRCKPRSSSLSPSSTPASQPTSTPSQDPPPASSPANNGSPNNPPSSPPNSPSNSPPTSTTSSSNNVQTSPPTNTPSGPGKLAVAWAMGDDKRIALIISTGRVKMFHLWDSEIPQAVKDTGIPVSIMLWSTDQYKIDRFLQFAQPGYASHAAGYNEVNQVGQGQTSPDRAVQVWYQCLRPLVEKGYTLMGPVTTSAPDGYDWMVQFFNQCGGDCHVDEVPIHWYDVRFEDFQVYINKWAGFGKPLRVTEFACQNFNGGNQPSMDQIWQFTGQAINYLESDNRILSYAPFGFMDDMYNVTPDDRLFAFQSYGLSDLGWNYVKGH